MPKDYRVGEIVEYFDDAGFDYGHGLGRIIKLGDKQVTLDIKEFSKPTSRLTRRDTIRKGYQHIKKN